METDDKGNDFPMRPYTNKELAAKYKSSERTFRRWMAELRPELGKRMGHFYTPRQVRIILEKLGSPFVFVFSMGAKLIMSATIGSDDSGEDHDADQKLKK